MYTLTIEDSNGQVAEQFSFDHGSYVIGRLDTCDIVLPSTSVSREHARIFVENDRCFVEDLG
ncbi:MAG: FHA domain-containing protein, partial [Persicimonas sp.]